MPERISWLSQILSNIPPIIWGVAMAVVMSFLRVVYDGEQTTKCRIFLEAVICGALTLACNSLIQWVGAPPSVAVAVGGAIGFIGVVELRRIAIKFLSKFGGEKK